MEKVGKDMPLEYLTLVVVGSFAVNVFIITIYYYLLFTSISDKCVSAFQMLILLLVDPYFSDSCHFAPKQ